jgi:hypothetical protein
MNLFEQELAASLRARAEAVDPPAPDVMVLIRGGTARQLRIRARTAVVAVAAAVAVVLAIAVPVAVGHGRSAGPTGATSPTPTRSVAAGPPTLPYLSNGTLHVSGRTIPTTFASILSRGGTTYAQAPDGSWSHLVGRRMKLVAPAPKNVGDAPAWSQAVLSPDGALLVAVTYPSQETTRLTAYDTSTDRAIAHTDLDVPPISGGGDDGSIAYLGIDGSGAVYWHQDGFGANGAKTSGSDWTWTPTSGTPTELGAPFTGTPPGEPPGAFDVTPAGPVIGDDLGHLVSETWHSIRHLSFDQVGEVWSPTGATVAHGGAALGASGFLSLATGSTTTPALPGPLRQWLGFESETDILGVIRVPSGDPVLIRCDVTTGACAAIRRLPVTWARWQWATNGRTDLPANAQSGGRVADPQAPGTAPSASVAAESRRAPPAIPMIRNGDLVVSGHVIAHDIDPQTDKVLASADLHTILVARRRPNGTETVARIGGDGTETPLPALTTRASTPAGPQEDLAVSADGSLVVAALPHPDGRGSTLVEWSFSAHSVVGSIYVPGANFETMRLLGIEDTGRVWVKGYSGQPSYTWRPGGRRRPLSRAEGETVVVGFGAVGSSGLVSLKACDGPTYAISPDGRYALCEIDAAPAIGVVSVASGHVLPLASSVEHARGIGFEGDGSVLVVGPGRFGPLDRCSTVTGECVEVMASTRGVTLPILRGAS